MSVYLDYAATAPMRASVRELLHELSSRPLGNPSSLHRPGHHARMLLEDARERCAAVLGAKVEEIVFTSGATEANNLAVRGWMRLQPKGAHMLVSAVEHPSVWDPAQALADEGYRVETIPVARDGCVDPDDVARRVRPDTALVAVMAVNNEVGSVQPVDRIAKGAAKLLVDAVQTGVCEEYPGNADFFSVSAHKLGGPVGVGLLYLRQGLRVDPLQLGGAQEDSRRAGTSNALGAAALALALEETRRERSAERARLLELRELLEHGLAAVPHSIRLGGESRSPHISSWLFEGVTAEPLLVRLDLKGVAVSSGSACSSHSLEPSRIVMAMGYTPEQSRGLIRVSMGFQTRREHVERLLAELPKAVEAVRLA